MRNDNDANCTYEGDNNVLLQQTSNWLISVWGRRSRMSSAHPMGTIDYLNDADIILKEVWTKSPLNQASTEQGTYLFLPHVCSWRCSLHIPPGTLSPSAVLDSRPHKVYGKLRSMLLSKYVFLRKSQRKLKI